MIWAFSRNFWATFGERLLATFFRDSSLRMDFGYGRRDVRTTARYHLDSENRLALGVFAEYYKLPTVEEKGEVAVIKAVMETLLENYHPRRYYSRDGARDTWNEPWMTIESWDALDNKEQREYSTDCDDYSILIYNLLRLLGVSKERLWLCFMKTATEWHMNVMYVKAGVPYAIEGTYRPETAYKEFLRTPYFNLAYASTGGDKPYYEGVRWRWNEDHLQVWNHKLNKV